MAIQPDIALAVKTPQVDNPLETAGKAMGLVNARQQTALNQQHLAAGNLSLQEAQLKQQDDQRTMQAYQQAQGHPDQTVELATKLGVRPQAVQALQKHFADIREQYAKTSKDEAETQKFTNSRLAAITGQALDDPNYEQNWGQYKAAAMQADPKIQLPDQPPAKDALAHIRLAYMTDDILHKEADEKRAQAKEQRDAAKAPAEQAKAESEATTAQQKAAGAEPIQPEQQARIDLQQRAQEQTATHNAATEKNAAALLKVSQGRLGIEAQHADIAKKVYDQTYGEGANPALQGVEPKLRKDVADKAQKASDEWRKAIESTTNVQTFIDMARKGNKAAGSNLPIMGAESIQALNGIRRINRTEIEQYQGAGSLLDRIQGKIGKLTSGQPIPADVMNDIESLHKAISGNATASYNAKLKDLNQNFKSNFQPVDGAKTGGGMIRARDDKGNLHEAPAGTALPAGWKLEQ